MLEGLRAVSSLLVSIFIVMTGFGVASYIVQIRALGEGWTAQDISFIGAVYSLGYTISSFITPKFIRRTGHIRVFAAYIAALSISILLCSLMPNPYAWMAFRGLFGFAMAGSYLIMESWISEKSANEYRGFMFSVYMVVAMAGSILGPYIAAWGDAQTTTLFIVAAMFFSLAVFPIALSSSSSPSVPTEVGFDLKGLWQRSPVAFVGTFLAGVISAAWLNFSAVYAKMVGLSETGGANIIAAVILGSMVAQFPLGRISDYVDRRKVMVVCGAFGVGASLWMAASDASHEYMLYVAAFAAGMVIFPIYALNVAHANDMADPGEYVRISSGLTVLYGFGVIAGPLLAGQAIAYAGPAGLPLLLTITFALYGSYAAWRIVRRPSQIPVTHGVSD
ncbi:MFS transporter [Rhizobium sp. KVB221]|uniref:MFS transporter n=1 Tax=Rhizobium setariae TaxID=2801340 RepID=A0A936YLU0_9HYPH|nr:MFS transporter [Rhizobium setariae]MBL0371102.1 MFS transporter [Rhizobium setariae]